VKRPVSLIKAEVGTLSRIEQIALKITFRLKDCPLLIQRHVVIWQFAYES
jgi:hypothetical protein